MSSPPDDGLPSVAVQKAIISASLNSTLLFLYLFGIYIGIYAVTIRIYLSNRQDVGGNNWVIIGVLTALFVTLSGQMSVDWYFTTLIFSSGGESRASIFLESATGASVPPAVIVVTTFLENIGFILADGLMVWRCFKACSRSILRCALPFLFFSSEIALIIVDTTFGILYTIRPSFQTVERAHQSNYISGAMLSAIAATSLTATFTICLYIYTSTIHSHRSRRRYKHIIDILIQSSVIYTSTAILGTILAFLNTGSLQDSINIIIVENYYETLVDVASALAPTLMVARLAITSSRTNLDLSSAQPTSELTTTSLMEDGNCSRVLAPASENGNIDEVTDNQRIHTMT